VRTKPGSMTVGRSSSAARPPARLTRPPRRAG
jgi:hypothetical protein